MAVVKKIKTVFQFRRSTTSEWEANKNIVPAAGEPCYDLDLKTLRIGDGVTTYEHLPVVGGVESGDPGNLQAELEAIKAAMEALQADVDNVEENVSNVQDQVGETNIVEVQETVMHMSENVTNLTTQIETTKTEIVTIQETLEEKADAHTVTELQTVVEQKVDVETVEAIQTELMTYIDEQIKTVEVGDMDGGVIE